VKHAWETIGDTQVRFTWVPREENSVPTALANRALDSGLISKTSTSHELPLCGTLGNLSQEVGQTVASTPGLPRNVRAPQSRVVGNAHPE
jgi:hypothetical protein